MKYLIILILFIFNFSPAHSQKSFLFESKEYKDAYKAGTRSRDGLPGKKYWQNRSEYEIKAEFDPALHKIFGQLSVRYFNASPDSLSNVVFKLMQNVYKKGAVRQMAVDTALLHDGIVIEKVKFNEEDVPESGIEISGTNMFIRLPGSIRQNSNGLITLNFITPVPREAGFRSGTIDSTSFLWPIGFRR